MAHTFTADRIVRILARAGALALGLWLVWFFADLVFYILAGFVLAYLLGPLVDGLQGLGFRRIPAILLTFVLVIGGITVLLASFVPFIAEQVTELADLISVAEVEQLAGELETWLQRFVPVLEDGAITERFRELFRALFERQQLTSTVSSVTSVFTNLFYAIIVIPFVTFFFLKDRRRIRESLLQLIPNRYFEMSLAILEKIETNVGRYLRGLVVQSISVAAVATFALWMAGLDNALGVGIVAGVANTIPYFGPLMGLIAGLLVGIAQTGGLSLVPAIVMAIAVVQLCDVLIFQPLIFSRASRLHPLLILIVVLVGAKVGGVIGMLLAIPVATIARVTIEQVGWSLRAYRVFRTPA